MRVYATSSERGALSASGALEVAGLALPIKKVPAKRVRVAGGGAVLTYRLRGRHWREASRALRRGRSVVVRLGVVATDQAGQSSRRNAPPITLVAEARRLGGGGARPLCPSGAGCGRDELGATWSQLPETQERQTEGQRREGRACCEAR